LKGKAGRYIFISTVSVFELNSEHGQPCSEEDETLPCTEEQRTSEGFEAYGNKKAECERQLLAREWLDAIIMRPALVYGKYDYTDRSYYWMHKVKTQDRFLLPNKGKDTISYTYVHDLVRAMIAAMEIPQHTKVYNLSTHPHLSLRDFTEETARQTGREVQAISASPELLEKEGIHEWSDLPLWIHGDYFTVDNVRVKKDFNISFTPFPETMTGTLAYYDSINWPVPKTGISVERENELLAKAQTYEPVKES
jgi:2'-hydroxyisoflavone reductase